jgi:hypothetical protein
MTFSSGCGDSLLGVRSRFKVQTRLRLATRIPAAPFESPNDALILGGRGIAGRAVGVVLEPTFTAVRSYARPRVGGGACKIAIAGALALALVLRPGAVAAASPPPVQVGSAARSEPGRIAGEIVASTLVMGLGLGSVILDPSVLSPFVVVAAPFVAAGVVCEIGSSSDVDEGRCGAAIAGAYVGALAAIPGGFVGYAFGDHSDPLSGAVAVGLGALVGYAIGTTAGGVIGWNLSRTPRPLPGFRAATATADDAAEAASDVAAARRELGRPAARGISIQLLSMSF